MSDLSNNPLFSCSKGPKITNNFLDEGSFDSARELPQPPGFAEVGCPRFPRSGMSQPSQNLVIFSWSKMRRTDVKVDEGGVTCSSVM